MANLMRQMTLEQGLDPRDFVVYAYGGAGGAHAADFARELGLRPGGRAAGRPGLDLVGARRDVVGRAPRLREGPADGRALRRRGPRTRSSPSSRGGRGPSCERRASRATPVEIRRFADMKFNLQIHQVEVPVPGGTLSAAAGGGAGRPLRRPLRGGLRGGVRLHRAPASRRASSACRRAARSARLAVRETPGRRRSPRRPRRLLGGLAASTPPTSSTARASAPGASDRRAGHRRDGRDDHRRAARRRAR